MTSSTPPPPGWVPPPARPPQPYVGAPAYGAPVYGPPVHKPGVVALRPLGLGDFFDGAFRTIRRNPTAMIGLAALVTTAFMLLPVLVTLALAASGDLAVSFDPTVEDTSGFSASFGSLAASLAGLLGSVFGFFAVVVLNGMVVHVVAEAVLGRRTSIAQAWRATRGRLPRLLLLTLLDVLVVVVAIAVPVGVGVAVGVGVSVPAGFVVGVPLVLAGIALAVFVQVRWFLLAAPALVLERTGVLASMRRAGRLSRDQFWRLLGVWLLTSLVVGIVGQVVSVPLGVVGAIGPLLWPGTAGALVLVLSSYLSQILVGSLTTPFTSAVTALQYVDQRIRKEGLDVVLIAETERRAAVREL